MGSLCSSMAHEAFSVRTRGDGSSDSRNILSGSFTKLPSMPAPAGCEVGTPSSCLLGVEAGGGDDGVGVCICAWKILCKCVCVSVCVCVCVCVYLAARI